ncbi:hypothetical protein LTR05_001374 [Lithohypha guttulata]|uniref:HPP transmembrane region domain-containing protein n=1 Tax=Lithohypha guttulata TaxID=1690604 RepID=A0AAN7T670_9EURO|nr:hypothetical protein LTR05_001374 [Lithohypha guttulata]
MGVTKTVHPPAGATALLAATTIEVTELGWWLLPLVLLASVLMLVSAMLVNNLYKRFPLYWWTPVDLAQLGGKEKVSEPQRTGSDAAAASHDEGRELRFDTSEEKKARNIHDNPELKIQVEMDRIVVPDWMSLSDWEVEALEGFQNRLREGNPEREN